MIWDTSSTGQPAGMFIELAASVPFKSKLDLHSRSDIGSLISLNTRLTISSDGDADTFLITCTDTEATVRHLLPWNNSFKSFWCYSRIYIHHSETLSGAKLHKIPISAYCDENYLRGNLMHHKMVLKRLRRVCVPADTSLILWNPKDFISYISAL